MEPHVPLTLSGQSTHRRSLFKTLPSRNIFSNLGFTYLQSMDFQREPQSIHHLYCEQEKPAHYHGSLLLRLGTHQIHNQTRDAHKISSHGTMTKRTPAMNWDHADASYELGPRGQLGWGSGLALAIWVGLAKR